MLHEVDPWKLTEVIHNDNPVLEIVLELGVIRPPRSICTICNGLVVCGSSWSSNGSFLIFSNIQASQKDGVPMRVSILQSCPHLTMG